MHVTHPPAQGCDDSPAQPWPPHAGDGLVQVRVWVPVVPQAVAEHLLHLDQPPSTGALPMHDREDGPLQARPPQAGDGLLQVRVCVPLTPQAVAEHALHADQPPFTGAFAVQERDDAPLQAAPPQAGAGLVQVRVWVPVVPQAVAEQLFHADQPPATGELPVQARVSLLPRLPSSFRHCWPPRSGAGSLQVRVCVPPAPQEVVEQALQSDQPPSTAASLLHCAEFVPPYKPSQRHR